MTHIGHPAESPCRVCGFQNAPRPAASVMKCVCCGVRMGLEDQRPADVAMWRAKWISNGGRWQDTPHAPSASAARS